ncbi:hypothetical protein [Providencia sp. MGF014]|uniref:hypothetical protein n=1 Tax=Providencia sp. MGF014 TaxID=2565573 RepID=UPI00109C62D2|nr:hypothetical protein [Providencia sp. MGF014]THB18582.1 hypothetical protein E6R27_21940 [Providencia sp. MGF014]
MTENLIDLSIDELLKEFEELPKLEDEENFFDKNHFLKYQKLINKEVSEIKSLEIKSAIKGAYLSACIKRYKRNVVRDYILKIAVIEKLDLTQRLADLFFIEYLGRSVGEFYLNRNFSNLQYDNKTNTLVRIQRTSQSIILNQEKKDETKKIIDKYKKEVIESVELIKNYFYMAKHN